MMGAFRVFDGREALAEALAGAVSQALAAVVRARGRAVLAVSGGTTPALFFENLSQTDISWSDVDVTLVDERRVPPDSPRANARLVREKLMKNRAAAARFVPLASPADALPRLDVAVLGMGDDGHTASLFPGGDRLKDALDPACRENAVAMTAPGAGEPRVTYVLRMILAARLFLHIEGAAKRRTLDMAKAEGPVEAMPVRAILRSQTPVDVYWCS
jgi:6-phosphogluconolactonase